MKEYVVNQNIRRIIRKKGLAAHKVAEAAGISEAVFSNIVRCERKVYADEVIPLAAALQVPIEELFKDAEQPEPRCENCEHWWPFYLRAGKAGSVISRHGLCRVDPTKEPHAFTDVCGEWQEETGMNADAL